MSKCVAAMLVMGLLTAAQAQVLDQSQEVSNGGISVNNNEHTAQGFVQGTNLPFLAAIWVGDFVHGGDSYPLDVTLEIRSGLALDPTTRPLVHTEDFTIAEAPADGWHKFAFTSPVALTPEVSHIFVLKGAAGNTGTTVLGLNVLPSYGGVNYALATSANGGATWVAPGGFEYDLRFRTYSGTTLPLVFSQVDLQDTFSMTFAAEADTSYALQATSDPANTSSWENVGTIAGNGNIMYLFDPTGPSGSSTSKLYRIVGN